MAERTTKQVETHYGQQSASLRSRIEAFYTARPDEMLSFDDMALKFDCTRKQAIDACTALRNDGRLALETIPMVRVRSEGPL